MLENKHIVLLEKTHSRCVNAGSAFKLFPVLGFYKHFTATSANIQLFHKQPKLFLTF